MKDSAGTMFFKADKTEIEKYPLMPTINIDALAGSEKWFKN